MLFVEVIKRREAKEDEQEHKKWSRINTVYRDYNLICISKMKAMGDFKSETREKFS